MGLMHVYVTLSVWVSAVFLVLNCKSLGPREALSVLLEI